MHSANFTIKGRIPSKKNSRNIFVRGGKIVNIPSKQYGNWHKEASQQLIGGEKIKGRCSVKLSFFMPDKRKADLSNKVESIMDLLVDNGIIEDDSWQYVPRLFMEFIEVDKKNPRVLVWITELEED